MPYEYRNARWTPAGHIDVELNHPGHGWIPCTLSPDDLATADWFAAVRATLPPR